jgi:hypothetical protein
VQRYWKHDILQWLERLIMKSQAGRITFGRDNACNSWNPRRFGDTTIINVRPNRMGDGCEPGLDC